MKVKVKKVNSLRRIEYYVTQKVYDELYKKSKNNYKFKNLIDLICDKKNILLAYRTLKFNKGSYTPGLNKKTIKNLKGWNEDKLLAYVRNRIKNYQPTEIRRTRIPKPNGKMRPLGIPNIEERLIQKCIYQVLEPICEAKFHNHSYGFRPGRSCHHAIARATHHSNIGMNYFVVDMDIKGFFDNVNHAKLLKQIWSLGIQDKNLISLISKMLKAPIKGEGVPTRGTPQGGILSPLLSNIVLNELDWWISDQWETYKAWHTYSRNGSKYYALKTRTKMKEVWIVRYADDFKIYTKTYNHARKIKLATEKWLKKRLNLDISQEKSKIVNLKRNYSEFLGFKLKVSWLGPKKEKCKRDKSHTRKQAISKNIDRRLRESKRKPRFKVISRLTDRSIKNAIYKIRKAVIRWQKARNRKNTFKLNSTIRGLHNYYRSATFVSEAFSYINHVTKKVIYNRTNNARSSSNKGICTTSSGWLKLYPKHEKSKPIFLNCVRLYPVHGVSFDVNSVMNYTQEKCKYTEKGRTLLEHKNLDINLIKGIEHMLTQPLRNRSIEYKDNRISVFTKQQGKCAITGELLDKTNLHCHHRVPRGQDGTDEFSNLICITDGIHELIHTNDYRRIGTWIRYYKLTKKQIKKVNELRKLIVGRVEIKVG